MALDAKIKTCLLTGIMAALCLLLGGCTSVPLLSQREIVHAVFFQQQKEQVVALLLVSDRTQTAEGEEPVYRPVTGVGSTPAQALEYAESHLDGEVFYGLMDLAVLPLSCDWQSAGELTRLLYDKTKPAPQIVLFLMEKPAGESLTEQASDLYQAMAQARQRYGLKNGLQTVFSQQNECALPVWQGTEYGFAFLQKDRDNLVLTDAVSAQLAAVLVGQADCLDCTFAMGQAAVQAQTSVQHRVDPAGNNRVYLTLADAELQDLSGEHQQQPQLVQALNTELQQAFTGVVSALYVEQFDPLRTKVWVTAENGSAAQVPAPQLVVRLEL